MKFICAFISLLTLSTAIYSQVDYKQQRYSINDGLKSNHILQTALDENGQLYIATRLGVVKYDGYRFVHHADLTMMSYNLYYTDNRLYTFNLKGLYRFDNIFTEAECLIPTSYEDDNPNNDRYINVYADKDKRVWSSDFNHIKYYDPQTKEIKYFPYHADNKDVYAKVSFLQIDDQHLWIATENGLWTWDKATDRFERSTRNILANEKFAAASKLNDTTLYFATKSGSLLRYNILKDRIEQRSTLPHREVPLSLTKGKHGILVATDQVVFILDEQKIYPIFTDYNNHIHSLTYDPITAMVWLSTDKGLIQLSPTNESVDIYPIEEKHKWVNSIARDRQNSIWLAHDDAIWKYSDSQTTLVQRFDQQIRRLVTTEGQLFACGDHHIFHWDGGSFQRLGLVDTDHQTPILTLSLVDNRELWLLYLRQIRRYQWPGLQPISEEFRNDVEFWQDNKWTDLQEDSNGRLWLTGWMPKNFGICYYDFAQKRFIPIADSLNTNHKKFVADYFSSISFGKDNSILFGGAGGFNKTDQTGKIIQFLFMEDYGQSAVVILSIAEDRDGNVFFTTPEGLFMWMAGKDKLVRLDENNRIPTTLEDNALLAVDSTVYLGIEDAVIKINPRKLFNPRLTDRLILTAVRIDGKPRIVQENTIRLKADESDLVMQFSDLSYLPSEQVYFRYRFEDDTTWIDLGYKPEINLHRTQPGDYTLIIEAYDALGNTGSKVLKVNLHIDMPFTRSFLFLLLLLLGLGMISYLVYRFLWNKKIKEQRYLQQAKDAEMKTLRSQMNPHFLFNTLNAINSYIILNKKDEASIYLTSFSKLMRRILNQSKTEWIPLEEEIDTLKLYLDLERVRLEHQFNYKVELDHKIDPETTMIPPLVLQPFCENAIWHGLRNKTDGLLTIEIQVFNNDTLILTIQDNGIGREASRQISNQNKKHKSYGINITTSRLEMLDMENTVHIEDLYDYGLPVGTKVQIFIKTERHD